MMQVGLTLKDDDGNAYWSPSSLIFRPLGSFTAAAGSSGSIVNARILEGEPIALPILTFGGTTSMWAFSIGPTYPDISFSGDTLNWTRAAPPLGNTAPDCTVYYGIL